MLQPHPAWFCVRQTRQPPNNGGAVFGSHSPVNTFKLVSLMHWQANKVAPCAPSVGKQARFVPLQMTPPQEASFTHSIGLAVSRLNPGAQTHIAYSDPSGAVPLIHCWLAPHAGLQSMDGGGMQMEEPLTKRTHCSEPWQAGVQLTGARMLAT